VPTLVPYSGQPRIGRLRLITVSTGSDYNELDTEGKMIVGIKGDIGVKLQAWNGLAWCDAYTMDGTLIEVPAEDRFYLINLPGAPSAVGSPRIRVYKVGGFSYQILYYEVETV